MTLEFFRWLNSQLNAGQYKVFEYLLMVFKGVPFDTTTRAIASDCFIRREHISRHLQVLQKKGFIIYELHCAGVTVRWVATSINARPPAASNVWAQRKAEYSQVIAPNGDRHSIPPGGIAKFARSYHLNPNKLRRMIRGEIPYYKGWKLG